MEYMCDVLVEALLVRPSGGAAAHGGRCECGAIHHICLSISLSGDDAFSYVRPKSSHSVEAAYCLPTSYEVLQY